ncbi:MAG TPA: hypothetical protein VJ728_00435 [Candidatus Binataceae bacterium]|nr:hypothetical protein [Candidatus Binataceae bacterium]
MRNYMLIGFLSLLLPLSLAATASANEKSVTGTLEDSFCYVTMGAHGPSHQKCAQVCAKKGIPVSLVEKGTGTMYILLPPKNAEPMPDSVINRMEDEVTVTGNEYDKGGAHYLTVNTLK